MGLRTFFRIKRRNWILRMLPELGSMIENSYYYFDDSKSCNISKKSKIYSPFHLYKCQIGDFTYIAINSRISHTNIGKFCSIGPNFLCGFGIHPTNGISTSPMFYSTLRQNGTTLSSKNKIQERKHIHIGNDVFIGMNVTVLDGVSIGDGAIIGAGAVVSKDIPSYAIAVGCPIQIIGSRFDDVKKQKFLELKWWDMDEKYLRLVEKYFFKPDDFFKKVDELHINKKR